MLGPNEWDSKAVMSRGRLITAALAALATLLASACARQQESQPEPTKSSIPMAKPLFSCGYANSAWGNVAYGHVLDDEGRIWSYDLSKPWSPQELGDGLNAEGRLRERFADLLLEARRVPAAQLISMRAKVDAARAGRIEEKQAAFDKGAAGCEAYLWEKPDTYRRVELGSVGDHIVSNTSPEALELNKWLQGELGMGRRSAFRKK
ncbi:MAG: hypothetical protein QM756_42635 [Polyangiaceae bacterium]